MEFQGEYRAPASPEAVWSALVDPAVLRKCVPGCESVERTGEWEYSARCRLKMGPVSLNMTGALRLEDVDAPRGCRIVGEGRDRSAGHAKGEATVTISPAEDGEGGEGWSVVRYSARAMVGGRMAQLGGRLIDAAAKKYADEFFGNFAAHLGGGKAGEVSAGEVSGSGEGGLDAAGRSARRNWRIALAVVIAAVLVLMLAVEK